MANCAYIYSLTRGVTLIAALVCSIISLQCLTLKLLYDLGIILYDFSNSMMPGGFSGLWYLMH